MRSIVSLFGLSTGITASAIRIPSVDQPANEREVAEREECIAVVVGDGDRFVTRTQNTLQEIERLLWQNESPFLLGTMVSTPVSHQLVRIGSKR